MERIARARIVDSAKCPPPSTPKESEKIKSKKIPKKYARDRIEPTRNSSLRVVFL